MCIFKKVLLGTMVLSYVFGFNADVLHAETGNKAGVIAGSDAILKQPPSTSAKTLTTLLRGTDFIATGSSGSWIKTAYEGKNGWLYKNYVSVLASAAKSEASTMSIATVNTEILNLRSDANDSSTIVGKLKKGEKVGVLSSSGNWRKVKTSNGVTGWVYSDYLSAKTSGSSGGTVNTAGTGKNSGTAVKSTATVTAGILNLRSSASTSSAIIGKLKKGDMVSILSSSGNWKKVKTPSGTTGWAYSEYLSTQASGTSRGDAVQRTVNKSSSATKGEKIADYAKKFLGVPYKWGGESPAGFDCSGFVYYVYKQFGITMPRTSKDQANKGTLISKSELKPGDLIFFDTSGSNNGVITHVGIYIGGGKFIHASNSRTDVKITSVNDSFYSKAYVKSKRVV